MPQVKPTPAQKIKGKVAPVAPRGFMRKLELVKQALFDPAGTARNIREWAELKSEAIFYVKSLVVLVLLSLVFAFVSSLIDGVVGLALGGGVNALIASLVAILTIIVIVLVLLIPGIIVVLIFAMIYWAIPWFIGKMLGGTASYGKYFGVMVYPILAFAFLTAIINGVLAIITSVLGFVPIVGMIFAMLANGVSALIGLVSIWYQIVFTREAHEISTAKAAAAVLLPVIALTVLVIVLVVISAVLFAALFAALFAGIVGGVM